MSFPDCVDRTESIGKQNGRKMLFGAGLPERRRPCFMLSAFLEV